MIPFYCYFYQLYDRIDTSEGIDITIVGKNYEQKHVRKSRSPKQDCKVGKPHVKILQV